MTNSRKRRDWYVYADGKMSVQRIVIGPSASSAPINTGSKMINTWWSFVWSEVWLIIIYGLPGLPFIVNADSSDHDVLLCWFRNPLPGPCSQSSQCPGQKSTVPVLTFFVAYRRERGEILLVFSRRVYSWSASESSTVYQYNMFTKCTYGRLRRTTSLTPCNIE